MLARDKLGICQWFHYEDYDGLHTTLDLLEDLGVKHFRTGISWADYYRSGGKKWYDYQMRALQEANVDVLLSVWHTPPSISEGNTCNSPPRTLKDYADFIDLLIADYGNYFDSIELWNEPNNRLKWNFEQYDPQWEKFGEMLAYAANWAKHCGRRTILGGMIPVDTEWLKLMERYGVLKHTDVVAIHGFPGMWWPDAPNWDWFSHWDGWEAKINQTKIVSRHRPVWITETGLATLALGSNEKAHHELQVQMLVESVCAPAERVYWYSVIDLDPAREAIEGFHVDENEYHLGLVEFKGVQKPAYQVFKALMELEENIDSVDINSLLEISCNEGNT
jgi:CDP-paratose 2-epimerase